MPTALSAPPSSPPRARPPPWRCGSALPFAASQRKVSAEGDVEDVFARLFPRDPALGPVTSHEDPTAPLGPEDWAEPSDDEAAAPDRDPYDFHCGKAVTSPP